MNWTSDDAARALEVMKKRASCRSFEERDIPEKLLRDILDTGLCAASGGNLQPFSIVVIRDKEENEKITELCGKQKFMSQAPVNLLFLVDFYKLGVFAQNEQAPYTCPDSYMHFLIAVEDVMCAAQSIETAAHLNGIGSCYVGTSNYCGEELASLCNLPPHTYPIILLSLGYPKKPVDVRKKLNYDIMVFDNRYPDMDKDYIVKHYRDKYGDSVTKLPHAEPIRTEMLARYKSALLTTFDEEKANELTDLAQQTGTINETQRRFGLHYPADEMKLIGQDVIKMMKNQKLNPFN